MDEWNPLKVPLSSALHIATPLRASLADTVNTRERASEKRERALRLQMRDSKENVVRGRSDKGRRNKGWRGSQARRTREKEARKNGGASKGEHGGQ